MGGWVAGTGVGTEETEAVVGADGESGLERPCDW